MTDKEYAKWLKKNILTIEQKDELLTKLGWVMECESPLEISDNCGNSATGFAAEVVIDYFRENFKEHVL